jgi:hypothetical protein
MWILQDLKKKTLGIPQGKLHWRTNEGRQDKCSFKKKSQMLVGSIVACCYYSSSLDLKNMAQ